MKERRQLAKICSKPFMNKSSQFKLCFIAALVLASGLFIERGLAGTSRAREQVLNPRTVHARPGFGLRLPKVPRLVRIERGPKWSGYLHDTGPIALRFSDEEIAGKRPPSPALPEFNMLSHDYEPYLIETPLPEDELANRELLAEVTVELEPHVVLSGVIDVKPEETASEMDRLELDDDTRKTLRPEEVLIFFEADSNSGDDRKVVVPFSPALPSDAPQSPVESKATYEVIE